MDNLRDLLHRHFDDAAISLGSIASLFTSNKTLIFLTIVYTAMRIWKMWRNPDAKE